MGVSWLSQPVNGETESQACIEWPERKFQEALSSIDHPRMISCFVNDIYDLWAEMAKQTSKSWEVHALKWQKVTT